MIGRGWLVRTTHALTTIRDLLLGRHRDWVALSVCGGLALAAGIVVGRGSVDDQARVSAAQARQSANLIRVLEAENRALKRNLQLERMRRNLSEKNLGALRGRMGRISDTLVENEKQIAFFKQLFKERDDLDTEVVIRSLAVNPDFREDGHILEAVLIRESAQSTENFRGSYELAVNLERDGQSSIAHYPGPDRPNRVDFRFYHEINEPFVVPAGAQILNARLSIRDDAGELVVSRILIGQGGLDGPLSPLDLPADPAAGVVAQ